jgi:ATP-dependent protease ClpP protease subunit
MILPHKYINNFDNSTKEAVMYLYGDIGYDVNGSYFAQEIDWLVSNGCKKIKVQVNSGGGLVIDAYAIFNAILNCPIPIQTINVGIAASAAGWCWLAGQEPKMMDYAIFMLHNAKSTDGTEDQISQIFTDSIKKIIATMCQKSEDEIGSLMADETFMDSSTMINKGMLKPENVIVTAKKPKILANDVKGIYAICNQFLATEQVPQTQKQVKKMSKVNSMLKLSNEASEEAQSEALGKVLSDKEALETKLAELQNEVVSLQDSLKAYKDAEDAMKETMVSELIENGIKEGKIEDSTKEVWSNLAKVSYEDAKKALNGIANKKPVHVNVFDPKNTSTDPRADWTIRDWEQKDSQGLLKMKTENNAEYTRLFNSFYKK